MMQVPFGLLASFRDAFRLLRPLLATHFAMRILSFAIIVPLLGALINIGIAFSDQPSLTDQDIAVFFLSPVGLICFIIIASMLLVAAVLEIAVMTAVLHGGPRPALAACRAGLAQVLPRLVPILGIAVRLTLKVLAIVAPFAAVAAVIAWQFLSEYDINYYLAERPPEFLIAGGLIGVILITLVAVLGRKLAGWALSIHLILFEDHAPGTVLAGSTARMAGQRMTLLTQLLGWAGLRVAAGSITVAIGAAIISIITPLIGGDIRLAAAIVMAAFAVTVLIDTGVATLTNGTLAALLLRLYGEVSDKPPAFAEPTSARTHVSGKIMIAGIAGIGLTGVIGGGLILDQVQADDTVVVIAHRGAAGARPENTMASIEEAIEVGADWIEIDVQETAEGEVVVLHDSDFMKLSGVNLKIWNATRAELDVIDIGSWFDPAYGAERTPSLRDVLIAAKDRSRVLIELKYYGHDKMLEQRVSDIIDETGMAEQVAVMSLKYPAVQKMRALRPDLRAGVLAAKAAGDLTRLEGDFVAVNTGMVSSRLLRRADAAGKDVYVWTVNDPIAMSRFISIGVDGLITDEPALAREVLAHRAEMSTPERLALWLSNRLGLTPGAPEKMRDASP